ncbi:hypothetical protein KBB96_03640 [Luteolibacter ambystomatis]|uniref:Uncharacterized protein n=2 Tax=Luteolibacter ambystomatis TaxID=2824561 RepID=A0A975PG49_9BACT|nr:hypothetical protein [Luteolibacter ambystomatis]QUE51986.1 hypothetical protein KBB96_03640 [Luteolibacter ambystomatis]
MLASPIAAVAVCIARWLSLLALGGMACGDPVLVQPKALVCVDKLVAKVARDPVLDSGFFRSKEYSYPWYVVQGEDGRLHSALDEPLTNEDRARKEHSSNCTSSHMGAHRMDFCDAVVKGGKLVLTIDGGLPAYASDLVITVDGENFNCRFSASYPGPVTVLGWTITKKEMRVRSLKATPGKRWYAWISVELDEECLENGKVSVLHHKIEGYLKPVVSKGK